MDEYIKREDALDAVLFALVGTGYQSRAIYAVKDVPAADVAPRAEVAREIFAEIREKGSFSDPRVQHIVLSFDELAEIEKKYTEAEPPKEKQPKCSENFEKQRLLPGDCFHGEIWYICPYCFTGIEAHGIPKDRICHKCGKEYL